jgi:hypothetical protein
MNHFWRLSEAGPNNLGLACTDDGLLLGHTSLIERRGDRFVVREYGEIERLLKRAYHGEPPVERLMGGLATVASALNADDQCLARIAAVHLKIPDLPSAVARDAMAIEDSLLKSARNEGSSGETWDPTLHPRTGAPPNPGWFAPTDGHGESGRGESSRAGLSGGASRPRFAENRNDSHRTDTTPISDDEPVRRPQGHHIDEQAEFGDSFGFHADRQSSRPSLAQSSINAVVPGAYYANLAQQQFGQGNYGAAAVYGSPRSSMRQSALLHLAKVRSCGRRFAPPSMQQQSLALPQG